MRPIIFHYATYQKPSPFKALEYDFENDWSLLDGIPVINNSEASKLVSKTKVERETDDDCEDPFLMQATKTDTIRESDDFHENTLLMLATKTSTDNRESDDFHDSPMMLLTKTEENREQDE